jgi:hypothetical protein
VSTDETAADAKPLDPGEPGFDELATEYGWVDAPPGCVKCCGGALLSCCRRHPRQKGAFVARHQKAERERMHEDAAAAAARPAHAPSSGGRLDACVSLLWCQKRSVQSQIGPVSERAAPGAAADITALYAEVEGGAHEFIALRCSARRAVSLRAIVVHAAISVYIFFTMAYIIMWARYLGEDMTVSLLRSWGGNLALSLLLFEPAWFFFRVLVVVALWPLVVPYVAWLPGGIGPLLAGPHAYDAGACGRALSGWVRALQATLWGVGVGGREEACIASAHSKPCVLHSHCPRPLSPHLCAPLQTHRISYAHSCRGVLVGSLARGVAARIWRELSRRGADRKCGPCCPQADAAPAPAWRWYRQCEGRQRPRVGAPLCRGQA